MRCDHTARQVRCAMTIWTVTIAMALGFSVLATLLKDGATFRNR